MDYDKLSLWMDSVKAIGKGSRDNVEWLLLETPNGQAVYKQYWTGPGIACEYELSHENTLSPDEEEYLAEDPGHLWEETDNAIPEPKHFSRMIKS